MMYELIIIVIIVIVVISILKKKEGFEPNTLTMKQRVDAIRGVIEARNRDLMYSGYLDRFGPYTYDYWNYNKGSFFPGYNSNCLFINPRDFTTRLL